MADATYHNDARLSLDFGLWREPQLSELGSISQSERPLPQLSPDVHGLAKRRNFKGPPIITNTSRNFLHPPKYAATTMSNAIDADLTYHVSKSKENLLGQPASSRI
jgi:hypothetical protein